MSDTTTIREHKEARTRVPPHQWRNVYWLSKPIFLKESLSHPEGMYGPGRFASGKVWPTKEIAEAHALDSIGRLQLTDQRHVTYLGAEEAGR